MGTIKIMIENKWTIFKQVSKKILGGVNDTHIGFLDGVRAVAVLMVFFNHLWALSGVPFLNVYEKNFTFIFMRFLGHGGVNLFYVLSGYLLFTPYAKSYYLKNEDHAIKTYARKRSFRILPAYYVAILLHILFVSPIVFNFSGMKIIAVNMFFLQNFFIMKLPIIIGVTWTLVVEVQFYIILPIIAKFFTGRKWYISFPAVLAITIIYRFIISLIYPYNSESTFFLFYHWSETTILGTLDNFAIGMVLANIFQYRNIINKNYLHKLIIPLKYISPILLIVFVFICYKFEIAINHYNSKFNWLIYIISFDMVSYIVYSSFIFYMLFSSKSILRNILSIRIIKTIGIIGYSFYLMHFIIIQKVSKASYIVNTHGWEKFGKLAVTAFPVVFIFSLLMYYFIEKHFMEMNKSNLKKEL